MTDIFGTTGSENKKVQNVFFRFLSNIIYYRNLDSHFYVELFNKIKICVKNNKQFQYKIVTEYGLNKEKRKKNLIVSLTSFPARIETTALAVNTLLRQTVKPDKLILWLAESQFPKREKDLPRILLNLKDFGLEIRWCDDLKSYKKLIPALKEFPDDIIITADDDLYYQEDWLESLYNSYLKNPDCIYARRASHVSLKNNKIDIVEHYKDKSSLPSYNMQFFGGAGVLYPPHSLHNDVFDAEQIKNLIPTHDDIYFWIMAVLNKTKISVIKGYDVSLYTIKGTEKNGLCKINKKNNLGMKPSDALQKMLNKYPTIKERLNNG